MQGQQLVAGLSAVVHQSVLETTGTKTAWEHEQQDHGGAEEMPLNPDLKH